MTSRRVVALPLGRGVAAALAATSVAACVLAVVLVSRAGAWDAVGARDLPVDLVLGTAFPLCGLLVLAGAQPVRAVAALLLGAGAASATAALTTAVAATATAATTAVSWAVLVQSFVWVPAFLSILTVVPLVFPDGRLPSPRWRPALVAAVVGMALLALGTALYPDPFVGTVTIEKPFSSATLSGPLFVSGAVVLVVQAVCALVAMVRRWRGSHGLERRQLSVLLLAVAGLVADLVVTSWLGWPTSVVLQSVAVALFPAALTVAVTRHRLYDLDRALSRVLTGLLLAACLAGLYLTLFFLLGAVIPAGDSAASVVAAGLSGLALWPLGAPVARAVDRGYFGDRADPRTVLGLLAERLRDRSGTEEVSSALADTAHERLRLGAVRVEVLAPSPDAPPPPGPAPAGEVVPLHHRGELVGRLVVQPRPGERGLDPRDRELLELMAAQAAPALAAARLAAGLQASRARLVAAREEERLRLRRDLHDGVGAALAGVRLQLESAQDRVEDPETRRMLDAAVGAVREAVDGVRHVTDELRPPALDELGLAGCLRMLAERMSDPGTEVSVEVGPLGEVGAATEVACYRIAAEALTNARRHAGARTVRVGLHRQDAGGGSMRLRVVDDGRGMPDRTRPGAVGLVSMRARAEELGGRLVVDSGATGTCVEAVLPVLAGEAR